jgi:hypothetical protein
MKPDSSTLASGMVTVIFVGTWIVLGIGGFIAFYLSKDVSFKRRWFPRYVIGGGVLFVVFATTLTVLESRSASALGMLVVMVPMVVLITYLNLKFTKFCDTCGATLVDHNWFSPMKFCSKCGALLDTKLKLDNE